MNGEHAQHWMMMISDDLEEARRALPMQAGEPAAFLRARIAENEAILGWLRPSQHACGGSHGAPVLGFSIGDQAQAVC